MQQILNILDQQNMIMEPVDGNLNEINIKILSSKLNREDPCSWLDISHNVWQGA